jgi:hypothetical protein
MITCPSCQTENPSGVGICKQCGGKISLDEIAPVSVDSLLGAPAEWEEQIVSLLRQSNKIEAIKLYRAQTGKDLKEAYDAVTAIARKHGIQSAKSGCAGVLAVMIFLVVASAWIIRQLVG